MITTIDRTQIDPSRFSHKQIIKFKDRKRDLMNIYKKKKKKNPLEFGDIGSV